MSSTFQITKKHLIAARGLLEMSQAELAHHSGVSLSTIKSIERGARVGREGTLEVLRHTMEARGIVFMNGDKPGVSLDKAKAIIPAC